MWYHGKMEKENKNIRDLAGAEGITLQDAQTTLQTLIDGAKELLKQSFSPPVLEATDFGFSVEGILAMGLEEVVSKGVPEALVVQHLKQYLTSNKQKLEQVKKFFELNIYKPNGPLVARTGSPSFDVIMC